MAAYEQVQKGPLKLKGVAELGVTKRKKKKKDKDKAKLLEAMGTSKKNEEEKRRGLDKRTPAQAAFEKMQEKRQMERILKKASKTHKQRVEASDVPCGKDQAMWGLGWAQSLGAWQREPLEWWAGGYPTEATPPRVVYEPRVRGRVALREGGCPARGCADVGFLLGFPRISTDTWTRSRSTMTFPKSAGRSSLPTRRVERHHGQMEGKIGAVWCPRHFLETSFYTHPCGFC
uniref:Protein FAM32A n=1 Tax=Suricata suricatta TaxID=37032 RepID=A0A673TDP7_SURSU